MFVASSRQGGSQPHGNSTSQTTAQQILHMEWMKEQKKDPVFRFSFFKAPHMLYHICQCGATKTGVI